MRPKHLRPILPFLALSLLSLSSAAQSTGVSHPDQSAAATEIAPAPSADHYVKPTGATATGSAQTDPTPYSEQSYPATGPVVSAPSTAPAQSSTAAAVQPALIVRQTAPETSYAAPQETASATRPPATEGDDSGIVTYVPAGPHELSSGTVLKVRLDQVLSTEDTAVGSPFSALLLSDVGHAGEVLLPAGSIVRGHVTKAHGGSRLTGGAAIRLQPQSVTLPDGTSYPLFASVSGADHGEEVRVSDEGVIQPKSTARIDASAVGLSTAAGAVTGAVIGGGIGAVVGAGIGAGVSTVVLLKQDQQETLPVGTSLYLSLDQPLQLSPR